MKRPLALIGLTAMLVLAVCFYADTKVLYLIMALAFLGLMVSLAIKKLRKTVSLTAFFATILVSVTFFTLFSQLYVKPLQREFDGETAVVAATLREEAEAKGGSYYYTLRTDSISGEPVKMKLSLYSKYALNCEVGDNLTFTAELKSTDYGKYMADRLYLRAYIYDPADVEINEAHSKPFYYYIVKLREGIRTALYAKLDYDTAAFSSAILLGDNSGFTSEIYEDFRRAGLTHIVVVSGLHLAIITMLYRRLFAVLIKNKYINALCTVLLVLFFLALTGFGKSSIRAAVMFFVLILSELFNREGDSLNSLGLAAILLCAGNPYIAGDVGVLLSFSATLGIVAFSTPVERFLTKGLLSLEESWYRRTNKFLRYLAALFSTTAVATAATLPVNVLFFGRVSLVQILTNMFALPLVQYFLLSSALCAVFFYIPIPFAVDFCVFFAEVFGKAILFIAKFFASFSMAYVKADYGFAAFWIFSGIALFSLAYMLRRKGKGLHALCVVMSILVLLSGAIGHLLVSQNTVTLYVAPAKNGQNIIIDSKDGNVLVSTADDNSSKENIFDTLDFIYTENQLMLADANNGSAAESSKDILSLFDYKEVLMYDTDIKGDCTLKLWDKATLSTFEHEGEVYLYLVCNNTSVLILPSSGDAEDIPEDMRNPDVLITSGMLANMELLSFDTLISNGTSFKQAAVIDYYRHRSGEKISASKTITFDIVG